MTDFDNQVKNVTSNKNELKEPSKKVKAILTKGLTKDSIHKLSILNGAKYVSLGIFQNQSVFILAIKLHSFMVPLKFVGANLMEYQKKVLKI